MGFLSFLMFLIPFLLQGGQCYSFKVLDSFTSQNKIFKLSSSPFPIKITKSCPSSFRKKGEIQREVINRQKSVRLNLKYDESGNNGFHLPPIEDKFVLAFDTVYLLLYAFICFLIDNFLFLPLQNSPISEFCLENKAVQLSNPIISGSIYSLVWICSGMITGAFTFSSSQGTRLKAISTLLKTWVLGFPLLLISMELCASSFGKALSSGDIDMTMGTLTVLGAWRLIYSSIVGFQDNDRD